jgi:hypothetical protein
MKKYGLTRAEAERIVTLGDARRSRLIKEHEGWRESNGLPEASSPLSRGHLVDLLSKYESSRLRGGVGEARESSATGGAADFEDLLRRYVDIGDRQLYVRHEQRLGGPTHYYESVSVSFINLPQGIGGAGGDAEAMNNRINFWIRGFHGADAHAPPPHGKVKIEMSNSALPREYKLRTKTGTPEAIAKYLGEFLTRIVREVPPKFTHTLRVGTRESNDRFRRDDMTPRSQTAEFQALDPKLQRAFMRAARKPAQLPVTMGEGWMMVPTKSGLVQVAYKGTRAWPL